MLCRSMFNCPFLIWPSTKRSATTRSPAFSRAAYPIGEVGAVLEGLRKGTHGIIIDGIDEGRSKTTKQGFDAFLDDLIERSEGSTSTAIVVFWPQPGPVLALGFTLRIMVLTLGWCRLTRLTSNRRRNTSILA